MKNIEMNIKKLNDDSVIPTKGSEYAAGMDLYSYIPEETLYIPVGATCKIGTGIAAEIPEGCFGAIFARSGLATKRGLRPANCVGVVDSEMCIRDRILPMRLCFLLQMRRVILQVLY